MELTAHGSAPNNARTQLYGTNTALPMAVFLYSTMPDARHDCELLSLLQQPQRRETAADLQQLVPFPDGNDSTEKAQGGVPPRLTFAVRLPAWYCDGIMSTYSIQHLPEQWK